MTNPKTRPIIFSCAMVRAILDRRKTQTRRVMKPQPASWIDRWGYTMFTPPGHISGRGTFEDKGPAEKFYKLKYGSPGCRLWVRETFLAVGGMNPDRARIVYRATNDGPDQWISPVWKPSIHMPRWASRITLEITNVRVERVQDISEEDALAEGVNRISHGMEGDYFSAFRDEVSGKNWIRPDDAFKELWISLHGPDSWDANPYVWALTFKVVD